ncbi:hypothetical protein RBSH_06032 [Rhodopirellula baltica SH28]|uniref:Uncharacterized protein n=1 Tax=Rhodopirellula baltica SH28 TaxID=993517 RepID=K5DZ42_RHOBT|nr:hypothetical protein RBSH_06032 [Rhodopirellula baltica SH28]
MLVAAECHAVANCGSEPPVRAAFRGRRMARDRLSLNSSLFVRLL